MPVYRMRITGRRKPILLKGETAAKARDTLVTAELITAEAMADALGNGEQIWTPGTDLPADEPAPTPEIKPDAKGAPDPVPEKVTDQEKPKP